MTQSMSGLRRSARTSCSRSRGCRPRSPDWRRRGTRSASSRAGAGSKSNRSWHASASTSHDTPAGKPDPEPLLLALEMAGATRPQDAIYLGDALDDVRMAAAAGVRGVGIVSMLAGAEELAAAGAVESAGSVVEWVERYLASA